MEATYSPAASPRQRSYTVVDPQCEWSQTEECDTLVVDVSGFKKEQLKVLVNTCGKLKVSGERPEEGNQWARFLKEFRIPKNCDSRAIRSKIDKDGELLYVILPKTSSSSSQAISLDQETQQQNPQEEEQKGTSSAIGSSSSSKSLGSTKDARNEEEKGESQDDGMAAKNENLAAQDVSSGDANVVKKGDEPEKWWKKIRPLHVLGLVLILAIVGVGVSALYVMLT